MPKKERKQGVHDHNTLTQSSKYIGQSAEMISSYEEIKVHRGKIYLSLYVANVVTAILITTTNTNNYVLYTIAAVTICEIAASI